jgi:hypothetical protein
MHNWHKAPGLPRLCPASSDAALWSLLVFRGEHFSAAEALRQGHNVVRGTGKR